MHPWSAGQLSAFLAWSASASPLHAAWYLLAMTGMRRGELLGLRWRDIDLDAGTVSVHRSVGAGQQLRYRLAALRQGHRPPARPARAMGPAGQTLGLAGELDSQT
jgi:integrase